MVYTSWGKEKARETHPCLSHCIRYCCVALLTSPHPQLLTVVSIPIRGIWRFLSLSGSIISVCNATCWEHAQAGQGEDGWYLAKPWQHRCFQISNLCVISKDQPDPLPRAAGGRSPANSPPCAWTGPAHCQPAGFALQRGAVPLKMLRYKCRLTQNPVAESLPTRLEAGCHTPGHLRALSPTPFAC